MKTIIRRLICSHRVLLASTMFCFALSVLRIYWTGSITYLFLVWNLFLAAIPFFISTLMHQRLSSRGHVSARAFILLAPLWLLFLPNAPYIITDLFHLRYTRGAAIWFDVVLVLTYAWTGLLFGLRSLRQMELIMRQWMSKVSVAVVSTAILFLSAFGIYLGRELRWNSWDLVHQPFTLLEDIAYTLIDPMGHPMAWGMTICMGVMLNLMYWGLAQTRHEVESL